jgi:iron(III) transport system substrate-binding protein
MPMPRQRRLVENENRFQHPVRPVRADRAALRLFLAGIVGGTIACGGTATPGGPAATDAGRHHGRSDRLVVYSGRTEELVGPVIEKFRAATGIDVRVRYAGTSELAATLLEEADRSPADVFLAQDAGALGAVRPLLAPLPAEILDRVEARFRDPGGAWIGVTGRARVYAYHADRVREADLPSSILDLAEERWRGRVGWAPTNGSFQAAVTALRLVAGESETRRWLEAMRRNGAKAYAGNFPILLAIDAGEIDVGLVNHYYIDRLMKERPGARVLHAFPRPGDPGGLVNVAGAGILATAPNADAARRFLEFLLGDEAQVHFAAETAEYQLAAGAPVPAGMHLPLLEDVPTPPIDLGDLADLRRTLEVMREAGVLP